jgi:hypothetical protein
MIEVKKSDFPGEQAWAELIAEAATGKASLITSFDSDQEIKVNDKLYKKYMQFLLRLFHNKCAYCESKIGENQPGDVEHYRPKGRVVNDELKPVRVTHRVKGTIQHPGYYWLAYEWSNLFPSCIDCNRARRHGDEKTMAGKADRFPVENENERAVEPGQETAERALLINPSEVDPAKHLVFHPDGTVTSLTPIGHRTIQELGLNVRETLVEQRRLAFNDARRLADTYMRSDLDGFQQRVDELQPEVDAIFEGSAAFAAVRRLSYEHVIEEADRKIEAQRARLRRHGAAPAADGN